MRSQRRILVRCNKTEPDELPNHPGEKYEYEDKCNFASSDEGSEELGMYLLNLKLRMYPYLKILYQLKIHLSNMTCGLCFHLTPSH